MKVSAQSPGHITGFFVIFPNGSTGAGLNVENGMKTSVQNSVKDSFLLNGRKKKLIVSQTVLRIFREKTREKVKVKVMHETSFPIGYGLGISGAGALSLAIVLNKLFETKLSQNEITEIAKQAEIECGTGLGDVVAENYSGLMVGTKPYPSRTVEEIQCDETHVVLGFFKPITTKKIIRSKKWEEKINKAGEEAMESFEKEKTMEKFMEFSRKFTAQSGLETKRISIILEKMPNCSMAMLGETVFIPTRTPTEVKEELKKFCKNVMVAKIGRMGAGLL